ncbi:uncharacterized protein JCM6883_001290, partial [Sporobolomyces salmoneus]|uniref:uncharacterized protein n=1 Tax=Sporobolomyces salmoneus TaxID=183962 RepID=UPI00316BC2CF
MRSPSRESRREYTVSARDCALSADPFFFRSSSETQTMLVVLARVSSNPYVGKSKYRSADGSGNNFFNTRLGAAGEPYARTAVPEHCQPQDLPDNGTVWDTLMKRDKFVPHPSGISSLLFAFATCITHSCFNTNRVDPTINDASSYLDLSPLY